MFGGVAGTAVVEAAACCGEGQTPRSKRGVDTGAERGEDREGAVERGVARQGVVVEREAERGVADSLVG